MHRLAETDRPTNPTGQGVNQLKISKLNQKYLKYHGQLHKSHVSLSLLGVKIIIFYQYYAKLISVMNC